MLKRDSTIDQVIRQVADKHKVSFDTVYLIVSKQFHIGAEIIKRQGTELDTGYDVIKFNNLVNIMPKLTEKPEGKNKNDDNEENKENPKLF